MSWFSDHAVLFALICAGAAVAYGIWLTTWLLGRPAGNERMQEIARAVQEGAAAYLRRQYTTIAIVAIVPFLLLGFYNKLGWGAALGFVVGASLSCRWSSTRTASSSPRSASSSTWTGCASLRWGAATGG